VKAQIVITLEGEIQIITREGNFETGQADIARLLESLAAQGVKVELTGPVEQHRHDDADQVKQHIHSGGVK
jgi:hypothetical protein